MGFGFKNRYVNKVRLYEYLAFAKFQNFNIEKMTNLMKKCNFLNHFVSDGLSMVFLKNLVWNAMVLNSG